jgi:riboflavin synthase
MFTGLIESLGQVVAIEKRAATAVISIKSALPLEEIRLGDSVAVNGVCLTVVRNGGGLLSFDASPETMMRTTFKQAKSGFAVNLERALRLSDRLDGHLVTGHVDCIATIGERREVAGNMVFSLSVPREFAKYIAAKGSVAVDGISLTVNSVGNDWFSVNVIPHTAAKTTLNMRRTGDEVNIETDVLARYLERLIAASQPIDGAGVSLELLAKSGFM